MSPFKTTDLLTILPAVIPCAGGLLVLVVQIAFNRFRAHLSYWTTLVSLVFTLLIIAAGLGYDMGLLSGIHSSLAGFAVPAGDQKVFSFGGQIIWGRYEAVYSFAVVFFILLIVLMAKKVLVRLNLDLVEVYQMMLFSGTGLILFICSHNLMMMFISLELASIPIFVLAGWNRKQKSSNEAGIKYFLLSAFSVAFLLLGIAFVYGACGSLEFDAISREFERGSFINGVNYLRAGLVLILISLCFKAALFPLHAWVADVYEGSITIVTAFMASLVKIASVAVIFKILRSFSGFALFDEADIGYPLYTLLILFSVGSMFYGNIAALTQRNLKRMLAYSSIAHAGYMAALFPLALSEKYAIEASHALLFYVIGYAVASTLGFGVIAYLETLDDASSSKGGVSEKKDRVIDLDRLKGLSESHPYAAFLLCVSVLSFAGIPPLVGFYGKFYILKTLLGSKMYSLALLVSINSLIAVFYYARVFFYSYWFEKEEAGQTKVEKTGLFQGPGGWVSVTLLLVMAFLLGIMSGGFMGG